jgi:tetratricopeptide (TPR) repeat protein
MAQYLSRSEQNDAAMKELQLAAKIAPTMSAIYMQRSRIYRSMKKLDESVKVLQEGVAALEPELSSTAATQPSSRKTTFLTEQMNGLNFALTNVCLDLRRTIKDKDKRTALAVLARKSFEKLDNLPTNSAHRAKLAGRLAIIANKPREAIKNLEQAYKTFGLSDLQTPALLITLYDSVGMPGKSERLLVTLQNAPRLQDSVEVMLGLARLRIRYKDYEGAENYVDRVLRANAQNEAALQLKNELLLLTDRKGSTVQSAKLSRAGVQAMVEQIDLIWIDGQTEEALAKLSRLRQALPKDLLLAEREINMHLMLGDKENATNTLNQMLQLYPDNENMKFQRGLIDKTSEQRLEMQLARVDQKFEDPFLRAWTKARVASRVGKPVLYKKFLDEAVALKPNHSGVVALQFRRALQKKNWDDALAVVKRVENEDELRGKTMRAQMLIIQGRHSNAIEVLVPLRKLHPDSKFILRTLGECYLATKNIELAKDVFGVLESNDPGDVSALIGLAIVTQHEGRMDENEKYVLRAYRSATGRKHSYISRRYLEIRESTATGDEIKKIIERREKIYKLGPKDPNFLNNLARLARLCEYRTRDLVRAGELYRDAYEKTGHSLQWARTLAFFYARNGQSSNGEAILRAGISEAKSAPAKIAWYVMHGEFLTMYDPSQAMRAYDQAARLDPSNPLPLRAKASLYARVGKWPQAVEHMSAYVARRGEDVRGRKTLIQYRINGRQYDKAEEELDVLLNRNPSDAQGLLLKAVLLRLRGSPAKAVVVATRAIEKHPEFAEALSVRARAYLVMGELEMAKNDLEAARRLSKVPQVSMELAEVYKRLGMDDDALLVLRSVVAEHGTYEAAVFALINMHLNEKDWANAEATIATAKKRFPKKATYWMVEAGMWRSREQYAKAVTALEQAVARDKNSLSVARAHLIGLLRAGQFDKALTVAEGYKTKPLWTVWVNAIVGRIMVQKKQNSKANELFLSSVSKAAPGELPFVVAQIREAYGPQVAIERMVAWSRERPAAWYVKVLVGDLCSAAIADPKVKLTAAERKKYTQLAIDSYAVSVAQAKKPADVAMLSNRLGKVYYDNGEPRKAEKAYKKCLEITPNDNAALNNLAYLFVDDLNEPEKALPYVQKVIKLRPQDPNVLDTYGWVMGKLKRYADAKKFLLRSIERNPELAACRYHLGWVFEQTGDRAQALKHYRLGLELVRSTPYTPLYKRLQGALKRLGA